MDTGITQDTVMGCIIGGAIGDAAGSSFENAPPSQDSILDRAWSLSDDTALTLATCEGIIDSGSAQPDLIAARFAEWYRAKRIPRAGAATTQALRDLAAGGHWALVGRRGEHAAGNGPAMRAAPLAFCLDTTDVSDTRRLRDICRITHHHEEAYCGALAIVAGIRRLVFDHEAPGIPWLAAVADDLPDSLVRDRLREYSRIAATTPLLQLADKLGAGGYVVESVPLALFAAARATDFVTVLQELISVGGDTDTNASILGQVVGAAIGESALPQELLERLPQQDTIRDTAARFTTALRTMPRHRVAR